MTPDDRMNAVWGKLSPLQRAAVASTAERYASTRTRVAAIAMPKLPDDPKWNAVPEKVDA